MESHTIPAHNPPPYQEVESEHQYPPHAPAAALDQPADIQHSTIHNEQDSPPSTHPLPPPPSPFVFDNGTSESIDGNSVSLNRTSADLGTATMAEAAQTLAKTSQITSASYRKHLAAHAPLLPPPATASWIVRMVYSWRQTHRTATRLLQFISNPTVMLQELQVTMGINSLDGPSKQQQLIQEARLDSNRVTAAAKAAEEEELREYQFVDIRDDGAAVELQSVSMKYARPVLLTETLDADLPPLPPAEEEERLQALGQPDSKNPQRTMKPKRRIDEYRNPFGANNRDGDELEENEGWFGQDDADDGVSESRSNSVRLSTPRHTRSIPSFEHSSLGQAMDPRQFPATRIVPFRSPMLSSKEPRFGRFIQQDTHNSQDSHFGSSHHEFEQELPHPPHHHHQQQRQQRQQQEQQQQQQQHQQWQQGQSHLYQHQRQQVDQDPEGELEEGEEHSWRRVDHYPDQVKYHDFEEASFPQARLGRPAVTRQALLQSPSPPPSRPVSRSSASSSKQESTLCTTSLVVSSSSTSSLPALSSPSYPTSTEYAYSITPPSSSSVTSTSAAFSSRQTIATTAFTT